MTTTTSAVASKVCANPDCRQVFTRKPDQSDASWQRTRYHDEDCNRPPRGRNRRGAAVLRAGSGSPKARSEAWQGIAGRYFLDNGPGDLGWQADAACRFHDPELFFTVGTSGPAVAQEEQAKKVCRACPVVLKCALWAMEALPDGIAGAMTPEERQQLRRTDLLTQLGAS
jgi:WhiB family redox-sensing transcriptional regulator